MSSNTWQMRLRQAWSRQVDRETSVISTIDAHTGGEPLRIIFDGFPELEGATILARRRFARTHWDELRKALMWEPRGHADMYGCLLTPPVSEGGDIGVLFLHNEGFSTMCGHAIIGLATVLVETGFIRARSPQTRVVIDTPAGQVTAFAVLDEDRVKQVFFHNVPSFVLGLDESIEVPGLGTVRYDLAFGGAFYAYVRAADLGLHCQPSEYGELIDRGVRIKRAIAAEREIRHPFESDLGFLYGTIFTGPPVDESSDTCHVCIFADGELDRCPTGTGVSGRLAIRHARGTLKRDETMVFESILGTRFTGRIVKTLEHGPFDAVIPEVAGSAYITGKHRFVFDPYDPLKHGFFLR